MDYQMENLLLELLRSCCLVHWLYQKKALLFQFYLDLKWVLDKGNGQETKYETTIKIGQEIYED